MKIRKDFVTNSSSSSFIVHFRDKDAMQDAYDEMLLKYSESICKRIFDDIEAGKFKYSDAYAYLKENMYLKIYYKLMFAPENSYHTDAYFRGPEFDKLVKIELKKVLEHFKATTNHRGIFAEVSYGDSSDEGAFLEKLMYDMPFVVKSLNNH